MSKVHHFPSPDDEQKKQRKQKIIINKLRRQGSLPPQDTYSASSKDLLSPVRGIVAKDPDQVQTDLLLCDNISPFTNQSTQLEMSELPRYWVILATHWTNRSFWRSYSVQFGSVSQNVLKMIFEKVSDLSYLMRIRLKFGRTLTSLVQIGMDLQTCLLFRWIGSSEPDILARWELILW